MEDRPFEALIDETAAGLKVDPEIYLETRRELRSHLVAKAEHLQREGHSPEESVDLAKKWFGSPMDVAAELLSANRQRMRLRSLIRLGFNAVFIPLMIVTALYVGYGRISRTQALASQIDLGIGLPSLSGIAEPRLPTVPFFRPPKAPASLELLLGDSQAKLKYWQIHRRDPQSHMYYCNYAVTLDDPISSAEDSVAPFLPREPRTTAAAYVAAMRRGERLEPENAVYNALLALHYLQQGMVATSEKGRGELKSDVVVDRKAFETGVAEWMKAARKPYFATHLEQVVGTAVGSLSGAVYWEDYNTYQIGTIARATTRFYPLQARWRSLARKLPGCARILAADGDRRGAQAMMDTWKALPRFVAKDTGNLIDVLVAKAVATILSKEAASVYESLGERRKAEQAQRIHDQLRRGQKSLKARPSSQSVQLIERQGSFPVSMLGPVFSKATADTPVFFVDADSLKRELTPGRMAEYTFATNKGLEAFLALLAVLLLGCVVQGFVWLRRLKRASAVPLLLMPSLKIAARAIGLGVVIPIAMYALYTHIPAISGRGLGLSYDGMWARFGVELLAIAILILWIPSVIVHRYVRIRCRALGIDMPQPKEEARVSRSLRLSVLAAAAIAAIGSEMPSIIEMEDAAGFFIPLAVVGGLAIVIIAARRAGRDRRAYGLYHGTLERSMSVIYALTILFIAVAVQPLLLRSEANWLKKDRLMYGYLVDKSMSPASMTYIEALYARTAANDVLRILRDNGGKKRR